MSDGPIARNEEDAPREKKLDELHALVEKVDIAMLTTRRPDGHLVSRPMATQDRDGPADLWFVTDIETHKLDEIETDPHVNVAYYHTRSREWPGRPTHRPDPRGRPFGDVHEERPSAPGGPVRGGEGDREGGRAEGGERASPGGGRAELNP